MLFITGKFLFEIIVKSIEIIFNDTYVTKDSDQTDVYTRFILEQITEVTMIFLLVTTLMIILVHTEASLNEVTMWSKVLVSNVRFTKASSLLKQERIPKHSWIRTYPAIVCESHDWCYLYCKNEADTYTLWDFLIMPFGTDNLGAPFSTCWTMRSVNNLINVPGLVSIFSSTPVSVLTPKRIPEHLLQTTFDREIEPGCFRSTLASKPYIVFDVGSSLPISKVFVAAQPNDKVSKLFRYIEIRVGAVPVSGDDFSSYILLGYFDGTGTGTHFTYETKAPTPINGRYISIQSISPNPLKPDMQMCYVEIIKA